MARSVMLDSGPLNRLTHPRKNRDIEAWAEALLQYGVKLIIPEIIDYETRRSLLWRDLQESLNRLDELKRVLTYAALDTPTMLLAASYWAMVRKKHLQTAGAKELDIDVILAAQAVQAGAIVATEDIGHMPRFPITVRLWKDIAIGDFQ